MKKSILKLAGVSFVMSLAFTSCELLDCKTCVPVSVTNGVETRGPGVLTCGDELAEKESKYETYGNTTSYYDCD